MKVAKKLIAGALVGVLLLNSASTYSSAASIEKSLKCTAFFKSRTKGVKLTKNKKVTITFKQKMSSAVNNGFNYYCASYVVFNSKNGKFYEGPDENFSKQKETEYFICRGDVWGWTYIDGSEKTTIDGGKNLPSGYKFTINKAPADEAAWKSEWVNGNLKKGVKSTITAKYNGKNVVVTYTAGVCKSTATIPVDKQPYLGLTGEYVDITSIKAK